MYCTVEDLRDEGISVETASDERLAKIIASACEKIDMWTQNFFEARDMTIKVKGNRSS